MKKFCILLTALMMALLPMAAALAETAAPAYEYTVEDIMLEADGYEIPATVTLPTGAQGEIFPAVIMCHGYGSNRHEAGNGYDLMAPMLASAGIASIRFDYKGNGDSKEDYVNFVHTDGIKEAMTCYDYMTGLETIDETRMGIMGWSMGGAMALMTAGQNDVFQSVCTWAGTLYDMPVSQEEYDAAKANGYFEATFEWREPLKQSAAYYECLMGLDVAGDVKKISAPILAINGSVDTTVVPETASKIVAASTNEASKVVLIDGADHTYNIFTGDMTAFNKLMETTLAWFQDTL